jgi:DNA-binding IscR family transcriptional regulator
MMIGCTLRDVWEEIRDATIELLGRATFADLAKRAGGPWVDPSLLALPIAPAEPAAT